MKTQQKIIIFIISFSLAVLSIKTAINSEIKPHQSIETISINLKQFIDLSDLEYDDSPYPGRTNIGHIFAPSLFIETKFFDLELGGWYRHFYVQFDDDASPEKVYPYLSAIFHPWVGSDFVIGNFYNLAPLPNTIYNEFLFFEQRPVSSGLKFFLVKKSIRFLIFLDWIEFDTEEHPEEFINGIIFEQDISDNLYYRLYNHYHHRGGQLSKDTHPVRIEQDIASSPVIGFKLGGMFAEVEYYLNSFSQNFEPAHYGNAGSIIAGYSPNKKLRFSYQCFYNYNYYHQDAHIFYNKRKNLLNRLRADYNIFRYEQILDMHLTVNLYGMDPPGIDFRLFADIDLDLFEYKKD